MKKTKIVCTIGPKTESEEMLTNLLNAGMNVMRLNFSHGDYEEHGNRIKNMRAVMAKTGQNAGILLDTKGPEMPLWLLARPLLSPPIRALSATTNALQ
jgi:pyruvate kinase